MKKNERELLNEKLFSFETAEEFLPFERSNSASKAHFDRFELKVKKSQKNLNCKKTRENKS